MQLSFSVLLATLIPFVAANASLKGTALEVFIKNYFSSSLFVRSVTALSFLFEYARLEQCFGYKISQQVI